jgi:glutathione dehydrogenase/transferase
VSALRAKSSHSASYLCSPIAFVLPTGPFCHRALLALEEKHVPYEKIFIDFDAKPQWLLEANPAGSVPVLKDLATGEYLPDSGAIVDMLEERFPEPALGTNDSSPQIGGGIFGAFKEFGKSSDEEAAAKEAALVQELQALEDYLKNADGPFVGGDAPCATDVSLMPKLYHMTIALKHFRGWELPGSFTAIKAYMDAFMARESWHNTEYSPELVIKGWIRHGLPMKK